MLQKKRVLHIVLLLILAVSIIAACVPAFSRHQAEAANQKVAVVLDLTQVKEMAAKENMTLSDMLDTLKPRIQGLVLKDQIVADLETDGIAFMQTAQQVAFAMGQDSLADIPASWQCLVFADQEQLERVKVNLIAKSPEQTVVTEVDSPKDGYYILATSLPKGDLSTIGLGFSQTDLQLIAEKDLGVVVQMRSWNPYTQDGLDLLLQSLQNNRVLAFGFNDGDLPSATAPAKVYKECAISMANSIKKAGYPLLFVEFFTQKGINSVAKYMDGDILRLHSISEAQMVTMSKEKAVDRFQLATAERNIRLAFVRFLPKENFTENLAYIDAINTGIEAEGLQLGDPVQDFSQQTVPLWTVVCIALGIAAGGALLFSFVGFPKLGLLLGALGFLGIMGLTFMGRGVMARQIAALASVIVFPVLSLWIFTPNQKQSIGKAILLVLVTTLCSLIGALLMVGLLSDSSFMIKTQQFIGVKAAHFIPLVLVAGFFWLFRERQKNADPWHKMQKGLDTQITVKYVIFCLVAAIILVLFLLRTGNENSAVSDLELSFRTFLDHVLGVRPRTKEFLFGTPFLFIAYYYGYKDIRLPLLLMGAIGQISLVNTFAHIHTPLLISILRTVNGLWLGLIVGLLFLAAWKIVLWFWHKYVPLGKAETKNE